jgi:phage terminase large subunit
MITTSVFSKTLEAYNKGFRIIANKGGTRSSKTFTALQLIKLITDNSKRKRIITIVSHSLPHLETGAIRDFDNILEDDGINIESVKTQKPYIYRLNKCTVEFVGFDKPGKTLGAARDILFINESNMMPHKICHHLIQRTAETAFFDWNPSEEFWFDTEKYEERSDCFIIDSTFLDNINAETGKFNITDGQIHELMVAKEKAEAEDKAGKRGYWWNWWQVYGLGNRGQLEGVIFQNWITYNVLPECDLYRMFVIDWGGSDPTTLSELNFDGDNNRLYIKEHIYQPQILNSKLIEYINTLGEVVVIADSARKDKIFELQMAGINAMGATKGAGSIIDGIERLQEFSVFIHENSRNAIDEFEKYKRVQDKITGKYLDIPEDKNNHVIDAVRYGARFYRRSIKPL